MGWIPLGPLLAATAATPAAWLVATAWHLRARRDRRGNTRLTRGPRASNVDRWRNQAVRLRAYLTAASFLLCMTSVFFWWQSAIWHEYQAIWTGAPTYDFASDARECAFRFERKSYYESRVRLLAVNEFWVRPGRRSEPPALHPFPWFRYDAISIPSSIFASGPPTRVIGHSLTVPHWFVFLATALLPAWRFGGRACAAITTLRRRRRGLCPSCGYDLRATPTGGGAVVARCPECGTEAAPSWTACE